MACNVDVFFSLDGPGSRTQSLRMNMGVVMSNSHHEPCLRHSEEWDKVRGNSLPMEMNGITAQTEKGFSITGETDLSGVAVMKILLQSECAGRETLPCWGRGIPKRKY